MAEKCTKTSSPVERWMNPYPFAPLNHFTVPFYLTKKLLSPLLRIILPSLVCLPWSTRTRYGEATPRTPPRSDSKNFGGVAGRRVTLHQQKRLPRISSNGYPRRNTVEP